MKEKTAHFPHEACKWTNGSCSVMGELEQCIANFLGCACVYNTEENRGREMNYMVEYVSGTAHCNS